jgi:hypothetical protein
MERAPERAILTGPAAHRALATLVPYANPAGGTARTISDAVGVIESSPNVDQLVYNAAGFTKNPAGFPAEFNALTRLPARVRLALEMVLHEDDERRAMEGQLAALEQRWREAEEIANIADSLLIPAETEARFEALRQKKE